MREFSMALNDSPGELARVSEALFEAGINILTIAAIGRAAPNVAIVTLQVEQTRAVLSAIGVEFTEAELLSMVMPDQPGSLSQFARKLSDVGVNINSIYILSKYEGETELCFSVDDVDNARSALGLYEATPP